MFVGVGVVGAVSGLSYAHLNGFGDAADCAGRNLDTIFPTGAWGGARVIVGFLAYSEFTHIHRFFSNSTNYFLFISTYV